MNDAERRAAHAMLRVRALGAAGYEKTQGVMVLEGVLREIEIRFRGSHLRRDLAGLDDSP